jgi:hypothetical protein
MAHNQWQSTGGSAVVVDHFYGTFQQGETGIAAEVGLAADGVT